MSIYKSSVDGYRDTTKWLAAFTPVTAILTAVVVAGAPVGASLAGAANAWEWFGRHLLLVACVATIFVSMGMILWRAACVLRVEPKEVVKILNDKQVRMAKALETVIGAGVLAPDFFTEKSFTDATQVYYAAANSGPTVPEGRDRLVSAFESLREWRLFVETRDQFYRFLITLGSGAVLVCAAIAVALTQIGASSPIARPTLVAVTLGSTGAEALRGATDCTDPQDAEFYAVGGTWDAPTLAVVGDGCAFGATWIPSPGQAVVIPAR